MPAAGTVTFLKRFFFYKNFGAVVAEPTVLYCLAYFVVVLYLLWFSSVRWMPLHRNIFIGSKDEVSPCLSMIQDRSPSCILQLCRVILYDPKDHTVLGELLTSDFSRVSAVGRTSPAHQRLTVLDE